jgi:hypothetical protein
MGKDQKEGSLRRFLKSIPGVSRASSEEDSKDQGNSYEFEATIGKKGSSLGFTFDNVSQVLGKIREGMKARVTMIRKPGSSIFTARIVFVESERNEEPS